MGMSSPSHHNPVNLEVVKSRSPKFDWKTSKTVRIKPLKKTAAGEGETSPVTYNALDGLK